MPNKELVPVLNPAQLSIINHKTPNQFIKHRPGPGGMTLAYVEIGYVLGVLNQAFNFAWDFNIIEQQVGKRQVWVRGELHVWLSPTFKIQKSNYGGSDIKFNRNGDPISVADDLKAAASDCLKKCASMLGVAADAYFPQLDMPDFEPELNVGTTEAIEDVSPLEETASDVFSIKKDKESGEIRERLTQDTGVECTCGATGRWHKRTCPLWVAPA